MVLGSEAKSRMKLERDVQAHRRLLDVGKIKDAIKSFKLCVIFLSLCYWSNVCK
jgi:hypothetical protein